MVKLMRKIYFYYPNPETFPSVSVTKSRCELDCAHCGGHYIEDMVPIDEFVPGPKTRGCLISGGCGPDGAVPLPFEKLQRLKKKGLILNVHTGLVDEETTEKLAGLVNCVSIDVVGDRNVVREVYRIDKGLEDYEKSLGLLERYGIKFSPHVCIGLNRGGYSGEDKAFDLVRKFSKKITLIVLIPTKGTRFANVKLDEDHVVDMIRLAREKFPKVNMGCMRPRIKRIEDELVKLDGVVKPSKWVKDAAAKAELEIIEREVCCACV